MNNKDHSFHGQNPVGRPAPIPPEETGNAPVLQQVFFGKLEDQNRNHDLGQLVSKAEAIYKGRRARERVFEDIAIFADPAWDILVDLFIANGRHRRMSVSSVTAAACVPPTTGLRWISVLEKRDLIRRVADPLDARRVFVELTQRGFDLITRAIAAA